MIIDDGWRWINVGGRMKKGSKWMWIWQYTDVKFCLGSGEGEDASSHYRGGDRPGRTALAADFTFHFTAAR